MAGTDRSIAGLIAAWEELRGVTLAGLEEIGKAGRTARLPRPGLDTATKHLQEMLAVEAAYVDALESGRVDLTGVPSINDFDGAASWKSLKSSAEASRSRLRKLVDGGSLPNRVDWGGFKMPLAQLFAYMISHEAFHQGQLAAFLYAIGQEPPPAWRNQWAMPSRP